MDGMGSWRPQLGISASEIDGSWGRRNGESFIINTIVSYTRRMFDDNDVVHVVAPTGMAVFNVLGETVHRFASLDWQNTKKGMANSTMEKLQKKLQNMVVILMDEPYTYSLNIRQNMQNMQNMHIMNKICARQ
jgi:hypothetical protein